MRFQPKTEKECAQGELLAPGKYAFEVIKAENQVSSNNNEMIYLMLKVFGPKGATIVHDYLLEAMAFKLRHFAYAVGLGIKYEAGTLEADDCIGRSGEVALRIKEDKTKKYPPKNEVEDYVTGDDYEDVKGAVGEAVSRQGKGVTKPAGGNHAALSEEDIPFAHGSSPCGV